SGGALGPTVKPEAFWICLNLLIVTVRGVPEAQKLFFMRFCAFDRSLPSPSISQLSSIGCSSFIASNGSVQPATNCSSGKADVRVRSNAGAATAATQATPTPQQPTRIGRIQ